MGLKETGTASELPRACSSEGEAAAVESSALAGPVAAAIPVWSLCLLSSLRLRSRRLGFSSAQLVPVGPSQGDSAGPCPAAAS